MLQKCGSLHWSLPVDHRQSTALWRPVLRRLCVKHKRLNFNRSQLLRSDRWVMYRLVAFCFQQAACMCMDACVRLSGTLLNGWLFFGRHFLGAVYRGHYMLRLDRKPWEEWVHYCRCTWQKTPSLYHVTCDTCQCKPASKSLIQRREGFWGKYMVSEHITCMMQVSLPCIHVFMMQSVHTCSVTLLRTF